MPLHTANTGDTILASDHNEIYNLLKGVAGAGESIKLVANTVGSVVFQPGVDPLAGTEMLQVKNAAGTVRSSLTYDGLGLFSDGAVGAPGLGFELEKTSGLYRIGAGDVGLSILGVKKLEVTATGLGIGATPGVALDVNGAARLLGGAALNLQNATADANVTLSNTGGAGAALLNIGAANGVTMSGVLTVSGASISVGTNPATVGTIRQPNATLQAWRDFANLNNLQFGLNSANQFAFLDSDGIARLSWGTNQSTGQFGSGVLHVSSATAAIAIGTGQEAQSGGVRLSNAMNIAGRNFLNTADVILAAINAANQVSIDSGGAGTVHGGDVWGPSGVATMTSGFLFIPAAAAAPTGVPVGHTGTVPLYYNTAGLAGARLYAYNAGWVALA